MSELQEQSNHPQVSVKSFSPIATCADSTAWFMVSAQMCRLWTAVTPLTFTKLSRTSLYFSPDGVPECTGQRWGVNLQTFMRTSKCGRRAASSPSIRTMTMSLMMVNVVHRTNKEKRKVQMGSAILYSGCQEKANNFNLQGDRNVGFFFLFYSNSSLRPTLKKMMRALTRTLMLCSRSPTTWTKAARTLALACWDLFPWKINQNY